MTDHALSMNLAGLNVNGDEVTEVYAYYFQPLSYPWTIRTADIFLASGEDGNYGFMPGNAGSLTTRRLWLTPPLHGMWCSTTHW